MYVYILDCAESEREETRTKSKYETSVAGSPGEATAAACKRVSRAYITAPEAIRGLFVRELC